MKKQLEKSQGDKRVALIIIEYNQFSLIYESNYLEQVERDM